MLRMAWRIYLKLMAAWRTAIKLMAAWRMAAIKLMAATALLVLLLNLELLQQHPGQPDQTPGY
jgi:hypothetical protein